MAYISELSIDRFRGIHSLNISFLNRVNLIVGDNNCGKTSVLEALQFFRTSGDLANIYKISRQRESNLFLNSNSPYENFICMFPHDGHDLEIKISGVCDGENISCSLSGTESRILIDAKDTGRYSRRYMEEISGELETDIFQGKIEFSYGKMRKEEKIEISRFSKISGTPLSGKDAFDVVYVAPFEHLKGNIINRIIKNDIYKNICIKALQLFDSEIEDMLVFRSDIGNRPVEYLKHRRLGNMPLSTFGDGIKKVLVLANAIARAAGGVLLIDEIETAIHKKYYDDIFRFIVKACASFDVQVFVTTHSMEAIDGILGTQDYDQQEKSDEISVITLKREGNMTYSRVLPGREVAKDREAFGFEVRL